MLQLADDAPRPHNAKPANGLTRLEAVRPHQVQRHKRARAAQPSPTVYSHWAWGGVDNGQEGVDGLRWGHGAVVEAEVMEADAVCLEMRRVVCGLVESHDV